MTENFEIIGSFIKDMSSETPDAQTFIFVRDQISKYQLKIDINSRAVKNELPVYEIISGAALAFAALLLILPGFATDFLGLLIIFPPTRKLIFKKVSIKQKPINKKQNFINGEFEDIEDENDRKL